MAEFDSAHEFAEVRAALGRAVHRARQRPSLWEQDLRRAPQPDECIRCGEPLGDRRAICVDCVGSDE